MKIRNTYINIISSASPYELGIEFNKKTAYLHDSDYMRLIERLKELLNTSDSHFKEIVEYIDQNISVKIERA